jgi:hypothetical protein
LIEDRPEQVPNAEVGDAHGSRSWLVLAVSAAAGATACADDARRRGEHHVRHLVRTLRDERRAKGGAAARSERSSS